MRSKLFLLLLVFALACTVSYSQSDSSAVVTIPEKPAEFKGGLNGWSRFLEKNLDRDYLKQKGAPAGRYTIIGSFLVDSTGNVSDIRIEKDPGYGTADEFKRVLLLSSKNWTPAYDKGKTVLYRNRQSLTLIN